MSPLEGYYCNVTPPTVSPTRETLLKTLFPFASLSWMRSTRLGFDRGITTQGGLREKGNPRESQHGVGRSIRWVIIMEKGGRR